MWNDSHRTPMEYWQKTSDFQKGKKSPHSWIACAHTHMKERAAGGTKGSRQNLRPWEGAEKEERFPHTGKSPPSGDISWDRGGAVEENKVTGLQRPKQRRPVPPGSLQTEPSPAGAGGGGCFGPQSGEHGGGLGPQRGRALLLGAGEERGRPPEEHLPLQVLSGSQAPATQVPRAGVSRTAAAEGPANRH